MKKNLFAILTLLILAAATGAEAQGFAIAPRPHTEVSGSVSGATKAELLSRARRWVALTFDRSDVIDLFDPDAGTIVLKWSVPVPQPSEWLTPTLGETCVIDIRDDGTWRLRVYYPRIAWAPSEAAVAFDELGATNYEAREDTRFISDIAKASFSGSMEWPVGEQLDSVAATHLRQLAAVQQFRSDRDKERGRATADYRAAERRWHIINEPRRAAATYHTTLAQSLAAALASSAF